MKHTKVDLFSRLNIGIRQWLSSIPRRSSKYGHRFRQTVRATDEIAISGSWNQQDTEAKGVL